MVLQRLYSDVHGTCQLVDASFMKGLISQALLEKEETGDNLDIIKIGDD